MLQGLRALLLASGLLWLPVFMIASTSVAADPPSTAESTHPDAEDGTAGAYPALNPPPAASPQNAFAGAHLTSREYTLSATVLGFGIFVFLLTFLLIRREAFASDDILRIFIVELIVIGTLFTVAAGFSSKDIAPAMGLFGTIAGYVLASYGDKRKKGEDG